MNDRELFVRVRAGEERAFAELFDRHARPVLAFARSRVTSASDAEDVAQAAFVLLWEKRGALELVGESALPWLLGTVRHLALANSRRTARAGLPLHHAETVLDAQPRPDQLVESSERSRVFLKAVGNLSPTDREVYRLCIDEGRSYSEAASLLGLPPSTLRGRLARVRQKLRVELAILRGA